VAAMVALSNAARKRRLEACARTARAHAVACEKAGMPRAAAVAYQAAEDHLRAAERCGRRREGRAA